MLKQGVSEGFGFHSLRLFYAIKELKSDKVRLFFFEVKAERKVIVRTVTLNAEDIKTLLDEGELYLSSDKTIYFSDVEGFKLELSYKGDGYKPIKAVIDFVYDENIKFTEG